MTEAAHPGRFERVYPIRFSHCDPAGIVFFPQYLVLFNHLLEDWFTHGLGIAYDQFIGQRRIGTPTVRLECDFRAISRMGEEVTFALWPEKVGTRSLTLAIEASCKGELRVGARQVLVFTNLDTHKAVEIPQDVRTKLPG
ncbi:MAG TPA: thioesterase family protein [Ottowia sp.]|uniref:acyl-CoA thioesterase n=1 Tax=Comamonas badia TaxID=265291 RepID=UPI0003F6ABCD|nr:thioesterase family protein [Comamonas badia]OJU89853.1 MAG: 4-hydroxybenzoyl-CoA thioesterase [Burkholderiales bacterium 66-5]HMN58146.1 thioesterase family protein [Ottowia sp.]